MKSLLFSVFLLLLVVSVRANVKLPAIISDNMVLQQNSKVTFWGWADAGERIDIVVSWNKKPFQVYATETGKWRIVIPTTKGSDNQTIIFKGKNTITVSNVLLGEVWLCSGQSNMHFAIAKNSDWSTGTIDYEKDLAEANYPSIRFFFVKRKVSEKVLDDCEGEWRVCKPTDTEMSAVAYFFGRKLHQQLKTPVGLVLSTWGGTWAESWTKREVMKRDTFYNYIYEYFDKAVKDFPEANEKYKKEDQEWVAKYEADYKAGKKVPGRPKAPIGKGHHKTPSGLYNTMIAPITNYTIKGAIWYQGESNAERYYKYQRLLTDMITSWRKDWNLGDFPFYIVQIAPQRTQNPGIREAQLKVFQTVKNTGMVVITDLGDSLDIHPRNKKPVGERLANWALSKEYGFKNMPYQSPIYKSMKIDGDKIRLSFDGVSKGLKADGDLREFEIAGDDQKFYPAKAAIDGKTVIVSSNEVKKPVAVRFAWKNFMRPNLFNSDDLPASPFRTDNWKLNIK